MNEESTDPAFMIRQLQTGLNALSKTVSAMDDRLTGVESESRAHAGMIGALSDGTPPSMMSPPSGSGESRTFAVKARRSGKGDSATTEYYLVNCRFMFGRRVIVLDEDFLLPSHEEDGATVIDDGRYYLVVPHDDPGSAYVDDDPGDGNDDVTTVVPLLEYEDGAIVDDYRGLPTIPAYETDEDVEAANEVL